MSKFFLFFFFLLGWCLCVTNANELLADSPVFRNKTAEALLRMDELYLELQTYYEPCTDLEIQVREFNTWMWREMMLMTEAPPYRDPIEELNEIVDTVGYIDSPERQANFTLAFYAAIERSLSSLL